MAEVVGLDEPGLRCAIAEIKADLVTGFHGVPLLLAGGRVIAPPLLDPSATLAAASMAVAMGRELQENLRPVSFPTPTRLRRASRPARSTFPGISSARHGTLTLSRHPNSGVNWSRSVVQLPRVTTIRGITENLEARPRRKVWSPYCRFWRYEIRADVF